MIKAGRAGGPAPPSWRTGGLEDPGYLRGGRLEDPAVHDDGVVDEVQTLELGGQAVETVGVGDVGEILGAGGVS